MIHSFSDRGTADLFNGISSRHARAIPNQVKQIALMKLDIINAAQILDDLRSPPGNRLEALRGDLSGYHSIRINQQWRIVFRWAGNGAYDVKIADYH